MPQNKYALARYRLIDELLRKRSYVKTTDIMELCSDRLGFQVSRRTIQLDMEALKYDHFLGCYFPIHYSKKRKAYYYEEKPMGFFLALCLTEEEIMTLKEVKNFLEDKFTVSQYMSYCSIVEKIENHLKIPPVLQEGKAAVMKQG